jgi:hypothetical protein
LGEWRVGRNREAAAHHDNAVDAPARRSCRLAVMPEAAEKAVLAALVGSALAEDPGNESPTGDFGVDRDDLAAQLFQAV